MAIAYPYYYHHHNYHYKLSFLFISSIINLLIISPPPLTYTLSEEQALLDFKKSLGNPEALSSWVPNTPPCQGKYSQNSWNGVVCIEGIVTGLRLKSMGLSGKIDVEPLLNLPGLRIISLENNQFQGPIPELNRLGSLRAIYLSNNQFQGDISNEYFANMGSLKKLWLDHNQFSGPIPSSLTQLRFLLELHLENNHFSGSIPPLQQSPLVWLDLSNNQLQGDIPSSLSKFDASVFEGNANLCGGVVKKDCSQVKITPTNDQHNNNNKSNNTKGVAIGVTLGVVVLSLVVIAFLVSKKRREENIPTTNPSNKIKEENIPTTTAPPSKGSPSPTPSQKKRVGGGEEVVEVEVGPTLSRRDSNNSSNSGRKSGSTSGRRSSVKAGATAGGGGSVGDLTVVNDEKGGFGMADLMRATAEVLGNGGMGSAYKAVMANGFGVAVKRMRELNRLERDEFDQELRKLANLRHDNILPPLAYHYRKEEKLVVYEYVAKGSLHHSLHGDRGHSHAELTWPVRLNIIKGITRGLQYLHSQLSTHDLPHGNLKSSNILINSKNEPLLSDYGFNALANQSISTKALFAYRSPEAMHKIISPKCDIYCLGVVILEIITGKFPCQYLPSTKNGTDVVQWTMSAIAEGRESGLLDPDMMSKSTSVEDGMVELLHIGVACSDPNPDLRPSLDQIVERIERVQVVGGHQKGNKLNSQCII